jgi:hypothetical protein
MTTTPAMLTRLATLNALRRRKCKWASPMLLSDGRPLYTFDLLTLEQAKAITGKAALADWDADAVFIRVETLVDLYRSLTPAGRDALANGEQVGGWFGADAGDPDADADGEFCSTPSHSDDVPTVADFAEDVDYCSASGVLFLY